MAMRPLAYDAHVHTNLSGGQDSLGDCVRAAEAIGLECVAIAVRFHYDEADLPDRLAAIRRANERSHVKVIAAADVDITSTDGNIGISSPAARQFALVLASLGGQCRGVDMEVPARQEQFLDNLFDCYLNAIDNPLVDVLARPFNLGQFPAGVTPAELPRARLREMASRMFEREVAFELYAPIQRAFPALSIEQFTHEYATVLSIFRAAGVKFVAGSGARSAEAVGNTRYCCRLMAAAGIELSQMVDLNRVP